MKMFECSEESKDFNLGYVTATSHLLSILQISFSDLQKSLG
jgi:hypothetical protein